MWEFPNIDPVAFSIGPILIRWYALAYLAGFLAGWRCCLTLARLYSDKRPDRNDVDDFLTWAIAGVILGGRFGYILFYQLDYYFAHPLEALKLWQGGMSFHGGALGVVFALILFSYIRKVNLLRLADIVCTVVPIGLFFGRLANFINGELYGRVTESSWGMVFPRGGEFPRHPSQLYEAVLEGAVLFIILLVLINIKAVRNRPGIVAGAFLAGYGLFRGFVEFFREPDAHIGFISGYLTMGQVLSLPMVLMGLGIMIFAFLKSQNKNMR